MNYLALLSLLLSGGAVEGFSPPPASQRSRRYSRVSKTVVNYNGDAPPFSESESPRDRARRMEMARELQKVFYKKPEASSSSAPIRQTSSRSSSSNNQVPTGATVLRELPTLTTGDGIGGGAETSILPGHQFVWNVRDPTHCHMFHSILSGPAPWYFAHVHSPSSSASGDVAPKDEAEEEPHVVDNFQSFLDVKTDLKSSDAPLYGTLVRITDRRFHDEDGKIVLAVQALDRVRIHDVKMPGGYLCTDVQLCPDEEFVTAHFDRALMSSATYLSKSGDSLGRGPSIVRGAARAAAAADAMRARRFEFLPIFLEEKPRRPSSATALRESSGDSGATIKIKAAIRRQEEEMEQGGPEYVDVVQMANYDLFGFSSMEKSDVMVGRALENYWDDLARETSAADDDLFVARENGSGGRSPSSFFISETSPTSSCRAPVSIESTEMMEYHVWVAIDEMMRLLSIAAAASVPLPAQLLGLLPKRADWPREFVLENYAQSLATTGNSVGNDFRGPFVRVDRVSSSDPAAYSPLRRASRLSYAIWLLLDGMAVADAEPRSPLRDEILAIGSVEERLGAAKEVLDGINAILKKMIPENRKDGDEK